MNFEINQTVVQTLLSIIAAALAYIAREAGAIVSTVKELNLKMGIVVDSVKDHEQRLRVVETKTRRP